MKWCQQKLIEDIIENQLLGNKTDYRIKESIPDLTERVKLYLFLVSRIYYNMLKGEEYTETGTWKGGISICWGGTKEGIGYFCLSLTYETPTRLAKEMVSGKFEMNKTRP